MARLRGLTFATLDNYVPRAERSRRLMRLHLIATIVLVICVVGLWVYFA